MLKLNTDKIIEIKNAWQGVNECQNCSVRASALFADMNEDDFARIHSPIDELRLPAGLTIYDQSDAAANIFTLKKGFIKLLLLNADGSERIVRVIKSGDLFGMEALTSRFYDHAAIALEPVELCRIPAAQIEELANTSPRLNRQIMKKWGEALSGSQTWFAEINTGRADLRVARFLLKFHRSTKDSIEAPLFERKDMGLMMDLKFETVSRSLASLLDMGLIDQPSKHSVRIPNLDELSNFCISGL